MLPVKDSGGFDRCMQDSSQNFITFTCISNARSFEGSTTCISSFWQHGVVAKTWSLNTDKILSLLSIIYYSYEVQDGYSSES